MVPHAMARFVGACGEDHLFELRTGAAAFQRVSVDRERDRADAWLETQRHTPAIAIADGALEGAKLQTLVRLPETQSVFGAWLVTAGDARSARNHTWHLRGSDCEDQRAAHIFGGRRNGYLILL